MHGMGIYLYSALFDGDSALDDLWSCYFLLGPATCYIYICTRLVYTTDTVPLGYGSVCHNSMFVRLLLVYQFIFNLNLTVDILLRAFKSFLGKYSIVCIFIQTNYFSTHEIFMSFIFPINKFIKFLNLNQLAIHFTIYLHQINLKKFNMQFKHLGDRDSK